MLLSCPAKKVTKECGIGEALRLVAPAPEPPSPMYPTRRASPFLRSTLTGKICNLLTALLRAAAPLSPLCRFPQFYPSDKKVGTLFVRTGCRLRCSRGVVSAGREILKRASLARGSATTQRLLSRLLLVLFLAKQEKYITLQQGIYFHYIEKRTACAVRFYYAVISAVNYSWGPAATRALPSSLPVYLVKFLMKRADRSFAFSSQIAGSA